MAGFAPLAAAALADAGLGLPARTGAAAGQLLLGGAGEGRVALAGQAARQIGLAGDVASVAHARGGMALFVAIGGAASASTRIGGGVICPLAVVPQAGGAAGATAALGRQLHLAGAARGDAAWRHADAALCTCAAVRVFVCA